MPARRAARLAALLALPTCAGIVAGARRRTPPRPEDAVHSQICRVTREEHGIPFGIDFGVPLAKCSVAVNCNVFSLRTRLAEFIIAEPRRVPSTGSVGRCECFMKGSEHIDAGHVLVDFMSSADHACTVSGCWDKYDEFVSLLQGLSPKKEHWALRCENASDADGLGGLPHGRLKTASDLYRVVTDSAAGAASAGANASATAVRAGVVLAEEVLAHSEGLPQAGVSSHAVASVFVAVEQRQTPPGAAELPTEFIQAPAAAMAGRAAELQNARGAAAVEASRFTVPGAVAPPAGVGLPAFSASSSWRPANDAGQPSQATSSGQPWAGAANPAAAEPTAAALAPAEAEDNGEQGSHPSDAETTVDDEAEREEIGTDSADEEAAALVQVRDDLNRGLILQEQVETKLAMMLVEAEALHGALGLMSAGQKGVDLSRADSMLMNFHVLEGLLATSTEYAAAINGASGLESAKELLHIAQDGLDLQRSLVEDMKNFSELTKMVLEYVHLGEPLLATQLASEIVEKVGELKAAAQKERLDFQEALIITGVLG